jgi:hypothetical protein
MKKLKLIIMLILLYSIAYTCPIIGGKATYMARNILAGLRSTDEYNDYDLCAQAGVSMARVAHHSPPMEGQGVGIKIYPNPAKDNFVINTNILFDNIQIFDGYGKLILNLETNTKNIDIRKIATGYYKLILYNKGEIVAKTSFTKND